jgi:formylmethanofuran dehydrogenase subunit D
VTCTAREPLRLILIPGRTTRQGQQVNVGKDHPDYRAMVETLTLHAADLARLGIAPGGRVRVRSAYGEAIFRCQAGNVPEGLAFVPYGPPSSRLMGTTTEGTGMPLSKGIEVDLEPLPAEEGTTT